MSDKNAVIALDIGDKRIGIALAGPARIASPLITLTNDNEFTNKLKNLIEQNDVGTVVVGIPRSLSGQETDQTRRTKKFINKLEESLNVQVYQQDEALTSQNAEAELRAKKRPYSKEDIDKMAAALILEDFLHAAAH